MEHNSDYAMAIVKLVKSKLLGARSRVIDETANLEKVKCEKKMWEKEEEEWGGSTGFYRGPNTDKIIERLRNIQKDAADWQSVYDYAVEIFIRKPINPPAGPIKEKNSIAQAD